MNKAQLQAIVDIASARGIFIHSDEVYRPLFRQTVVEPPPSILSFGYEKTIAAGSMSKTFSLAGIRVGWLASNSKSIIETCASTRDYTTISVSQLDDAVATTATDPSVMRSLLKRNLDLADHNLDMLAALVEEYPSICEWTKPQGGTTAFIKFKNKDKSLVDDVAFCKALQAKTGTMFVPGCECFGHGEDFKGYIRIGYVCETKVLEDGLAASRRFLAESYVGSHSVAQP